MGVGTHHHQAIILRPENKYPQNTLQGPFKWDLVKAGAGWGGKWELMGKSGVGWELMGKRRGGVGKGILLCLSAPVVLGSSILIQLSFAKKVG